MNLVNFQLEYVILAMAGVILYLLYYVYSKDAEYSKNVHSVASVVEELNREIFYLKKSVSKTQLTIKETSRDMSDEDIYQEIERSVYDMIHPLTVGIKQIEHTISTLDSQIDTRISNLESGVKQISIPSSIHGNDDEKIITLYKQGVSLDTIAKELHISKAEAEFVLKINKIK